MKYLKTFENETNSDILKIENFIRYYIRYKINIIGEIKKLRLSDFDGWSYDYHSFFDDITIGLGKYYSKNKGVLNAADNFCKDNNIPIYLDVSIGGGWGLYLNILNGQKMVWRNM